MSETTSLQKSPLLGLIFFGVCLLLGGWLFADALANIFSRWSYQAEYSHGFLIPLVSLYILWENKARLSATQTAGSWWALPVLLIAIVFLFVGEISALYIILHYAFLFLLLAFALAFLGRAARYALVPIGLLVFSIPLPYIVEVVLTAKLQLMSSDLGVKLIRLFNIPVFLSGNIIDLGTFKLHVVEACSGMRYLFPLACIGFVTAYFYRAAFWLKAIVFLTTIPITLFMNSFRIAVTGVLVENFGPQTAEGFLHDFEGWAVFLLCMAVLILEIVLLEKLTLGRSLAVAFRPITADETVNETPASVTKKTMNMPLIILTIVSLCAAKFTLISIDHRQEAFLKSTSLAAFPLTLHTESGDVWQGERMTMAADVLAELQADDYFLADYAPRENRDDTVNFYVAYYESQRKGVSPHSPKVCMPGGGWEIAEFSRTELTDIQASYYVAGSKNMPVNRAVIRNGTKAQLVYYWFFERGDVVANEYIKKWWLLKDALFHNRTDGALVRVVTPIEQNNIDAAEARIKAFVKIAQPTLSRYLPEAPH